MPRIDQVDEVRGYLLGDGNDVTDINGKLGLSIPACADSDHIHSYQSNDVDHTDIPVSASIPHVMVLGATGDQGMPVVVTGNADFPDIVSTGTSCVDDSDDDGIGPRSGVTDINDSGVTDLIDSACSGMPPDIDEDNYSEAIGHVHRSNVIHAACSSNVDAAADTISVSAPPTLPYHFS